MGDVPTWHVWATLLLCPLLVVLGSPVAAGFAGGAGVGWLLAATYVRWEREAARCDGG